MYRVTLNWNIEEIDVPENVDVIDAEVISDVHIDADLDISEISYYDALAQQLMDNQGRHR